MVAGIFHPGSGLGNQLHRYVATRVLALDKGYEFSMLAPELFKGKDFMQLDMGVKNLTDYTIEHPSGKVIPGYNLIYPQEGKEGFYWNEWGKNVYDPDINFVTDNTTIDGNFEDPKYFEHRLPEIDQWLKIKKPLWEIKKPWGLDYRMTPQDNFCVIGFRGGEYYSVPELGLPKEYYDHAIEEMLKINPKMHFEVHTDDPELAEQFFGQGLKIIRNIEINWSSMRYAKYAIIANSSFYILPRLLAHQQYEKSNDHHLTIAPKWWNRYNIQKWKYPQNYYKEFTYIV